MSENHNKETEEVLEKQAEETASQAEESTETPEDPASDTPSEESSSADVQELKDKYLRLFAEFDNYKKRTTRERLDLLRSSTQDMMAAMLPVLDDFDRARGEAEKQGQEKDPVVAGLLLVQHKMQNILTGKGLEAMTSTGEDFDPELHEAVTEIPAPSPDLQGKVIDTIEKGYRLNDKIIRYAKVVVGK